MKDISDFNDVFYRIKNEHEQRDYWYVMPFFEQRLEEQGWIKKKTESKVNDREINKIV